MAIYITGDIHSNPERLSNKNFKRQGLLPLTKGDIVLLCGDFGLPWAMDKYDKHWLEWLSERPATVAFVDGNHENFDLLSNFPVKNWNGGKVHEILPNVLHMMRGEVFDIEGYSVLTFGGAESQDIVRRKEGVSWWAQEIFSQVELQNLTRNLETVNYKVDLVLTHTAPQKFIKPKEKELCLDWSNRIKDLVCQMLSRLENDLTYQMWYFGHFHFNWVDKAQKCRGIYTAIDKVNE